MAYEPRNLERWTMASNYMGYDWSEYYRTKFTTHNGSGDLDDSNFAVALQKLGGESETVVIAEFSDWLIGHITTIFIHHTDERALRIADDLRDKMERYPVLDEHDFCERESRTALELWKSFSTKERLKYMRKNFADEFSSVEFRDLILCARGAIFYGDRANLVGR